MHACIHNLGIWIANPSNYPLAEFNLRSLLVDGVEYDIERTAENATLGYIRRAGCRQLKTRYGRHACIQNLEIWIASLTNYPSA